MTKISLIIPVYNALDDLRLCLDSILNNFNFNLGEIFIINDCSDDITSKYLEEFKNSHPIINVLKNEENLGFVQTCNRGMKAASGDIVVLLNSDTKIPKQFCERIIKCFNSNPNIGIASPISSSTAWYFIPLPNKMNLDEMNELLRKKHKCAYPLIPSAEGYCFCIRKEVIEKQGYLDVVWGKGYHEEIDYAYRAITNGWINVLIDDLYVYHKRHASFGSKKRAELIKQNNRLFLERWAGFEENYRKEHSLINPVRKIEAELFPSIYFKRIIFGFIKNIFSVSNSEDKKHKIIRLCGIKFKLKRKFKTNKNLISINKILTDKKSITYKHKSAIVFAVYTEDGIIPQNTVEYMIELKKYTDYLIVVGDCLICEDGLSKIESIADSYIFKKHKEYDFGSYKRGFQYLKNEEILEHVNHLILCNDSVFYLGKSLMDIFKQAYDRDLFGITLNKGGYSKKLTIEMGIPHLQSYFISLSDKIFNEEYFAKFINSVKRYKSKELIVYNCEQKLSKILKDNGHKLYSYYPPLETENYIDPCSYYLSPNSNYSGGGGKIFYKKYYTAT